MEFAKLGKKEEKANKQIYRIILKYKTSKKN